MTMYAAMLGFALAAALIGGTERPEPPTKAPATRAKAKARPVPGNVFVLYEGGGASRRHAEPAIQELARRIAEVGPWDIVDGHFFSRREALAAKFGEQRPDLVILPLAAHLELQDKLSLRPIRDVELVSPGESRFHLVTADPQRKSCTSAKVVSNHLSDWAFILGIVANGAWSKSDFDWVDQARPMQVIKTVLRGESECALVDEAQLQMAANLEPEKPLHRVWSSETLPVMIASALREEAVWNGALGRVCQAADAAKACEAAGIRSFSPISSQRLKALSKRYAAGAKLAEQASEAPATPDTPPK